MAFRWITCPDTAHLERLEYEDTAAGILVASCSRFDASCTPGCPRTCAVRLDRRARREGRLEDPRRERSDERTPRYIEVRSLLRIR